MADVGVTYTLATPGPDIVFNQFTDPFVGNNDQYYISEIRGLAAPALRTPFDNVPLGDGGLIHDFWFGPRHIGIEGTILVQSTGVMNDVVEIRNEMEADLQDALNSIIRSDGTLTFTPQGQSLITYTVRYEVALEFTHSNNYLSLDFGFGLIAGDPGV